jgi:hypothetical protein
MPRGKSTVMAIFCAETNMRLGTLRLNPKSKSGTTKDDLQKKITKYNPKLRKRVAIKLKDEKK